jgi:hypothetical protein
MPRFVKLSLSFLILIVSAGSAAAQTGCGQHLTYYFPDPAGFPPSAFNITYGGPFMDYYDIMVGCAPASAAVESCPTCPKAAQPIVLSTGNTYIKQTDLQIPGLGGGLSLLRTWNSLWPAGGPPFRPLLAEGGQTDSPLFRTGGPVN